MPYVGSVKLTVNRVDWNKYKAVVDLGVSPYPFGSVPVNVMLLVDGKVYAVKTVNVSACGRPPGELCPGRCEFDLELPLGTHVLEARARDHGDDKMYPDDFLRSLRPVEKWVYYFYPIVYVRARGSTANPQYITAPYAFLDSVRDNLWYYNWQSLNVIKWVDVPLEYPPGYRALKEVEWEGTFIYEINADETTEGIASKIVNWMKSRWGLEDSSADACIAGVHSKYVG